jgi:hypothetical protein
VNYDRTAAIFFAAYSYPILLLPLFAIWVVWGMFKDAAEDGIGGVTQACLAILSFGALCATIYGYWTGQNEVGGYGLLALFGFGALMGLREAVSKWMARRAEHGPRSTRRRGLCAKGHWRLVQSLSPFPATTLAITPGRTLS